MVCMRDNAKGVGRMSEHYPRRGDTMMTPDHIADQVHSSGSFRVGIGRSSWKGLSTGQWTKLWQN